VLILMSFYVIANPQLQWINPLAIYPLVALLMFVISFRRAQR